MAAKKRPPIQTVGYVPLTPDGSIMMCTADMNPEQREYVGRAISARILNTYYAGQYEFDPHLPPPETVFPQLRGLRTDD